MQRCKYLSELLKKQKQKEDGLSDGDAVADSEPNNEIITNAQRILQLFIKYCIKLCLYVYVLYD